MSSPITEDRTFGTARPSWPDTNSEGRKPNIVVMVADDLGFSDLGCFGSEIPTPNIDEIANAGLLYQNFHVTPSCSPSRAALLTGMNPHRVGFGCVAQSDRGFPGYRSALPDDVVTLPEILGANGYNTFHVGKWHLTPRDEMHDGASRRNWPLSRGFDRYYGFLEGCTNYHHPHQLCEDNRLVKTETYPENYYLTDDLTEQAVRMIRDAHASDPDRPFFLYFAHGAVHAPLQAKSEDIERFHERYALGWDQLREERFRRQVELGLFSDQLTVPPRETETFYDVEVWDRLSAKQKTLYARYMEVYAAMVVSIDQSMGSLRQALLELGVWEDTIVLILSDNGASKEGGPTGTTEHLRGLQIWINRTTDLDRDYDRLDQIGGPQVLAHYPRGWAMACNTPFRFYKLTAYAGGRRAPLVFSWPRRINAPGLRRQFVYISDILPTLLELTDIDYPPFRSTEPVSATGTSFTTSLDDADAPASRREQYWEVTGHRAFYRDGWMALTLRQPGAAFGPHEWRLYETSSDPMEQSDLAEQCPNRVAELIDAWEEAALRDCVYPLDEGLGFRERLIPTRELSLARKTELTADGDLERVKSAYLIQGRSFRIEISFTSVSASDGVLVSHGSQGSGYIFFVEGSTLKYAHNAFGVDKEWEFAELDPGPHLVCADFAAQPDRTWSLTVRCGDDGVPSPTVERLTMFDGWAPMEGISVGMDRRSPVLWRLRREYGSFRFAGTIHHVTYIPGRSLSEMSNDVEEEEFFA